jgi:hypothetical protein
MVCFNKFQQGTPLLVINIITFLIWDFNRSFRPPRGPPNLGCNESNSLRTFYKYKTACLTVSGLRIYYGVGSRSASILRSWIANQIGIPLNIHAMRVVGS